MATFLHCTALRPLNSGHARCFIVAGKCVAIDATAAHGVGPPLWQFKLSLRGGGGRLRRSKVYSELTQLNEEGSERDRARRRCEGYFSMILCTRTMTS